MAARARAVCVEAANAAALDAKGATATSAAAAAAGADDEAAKRQPTEPGIEIVFVSCDIEDVGDAGSPPPPWLKARRRAPRRARVAPPRRECLP